jgi:hypothetical protein
LNDATGEVSESPVALEHGAAERLLELAQHLHRHGRAAGDAHSQRRQVVVIAVRYGQQRAVHRGNADERRCPVLRKQLQCLLRVEAREQ